MFSVSSAYPPSAAAAKTSANDLPVIPELRDRHCVYALIPKQLREPYRVNLVEEELHCVPAAAVS